MPNRPALLLTCLLCLSMGFLPMGRVAQANSGPNVVFLSPDDSRFWYMVSDFMTEVAKDLGMNLEVVFDHDSHRYSYLKIAEHVLGRENKPDYLVFMFREQVANRMLTYANEMGVKVFTFNTDIPAATKASVGGPRETLSNWIGHLVPDNLAAGRALVSILTEQALHMGLIEPEQVLPIVGLSGTLDSSAAKDRQQGLEDMARSKQSELFQFVDAQWSRQQAKTKTQVLLQRFPQAAAIWSASDGMALGAIDAVKMMGIRPGADVVIGGIDWEPQALEAIRAGELAVSLGRHFMGGGLALLLLHDYHHGFDFSDETSPPMLSYQLKPVTIDNVDKVEKIMDPEHWRNADFRSFSRTLGSGKSKHKQSAEELMDGFTSALVGAYSRSVSRLPDGASVGSSSDSGNK